MRLDPVQGRRGATLALVLLGCLAVRAGRPLDIDAATVTPTNMKVPDEWLLPTYRRGWTL